MFTTSYGCLEKWGEKNETVFIALHRLYIGGMKEGCFEGGSLHRGFGKGRNDGVGEVFALMRLQDTRKRPQNAQEMVLRWLGRECLKGAEMCRETAVIKQFGRDSMT